MHRDASHKLLWALSEEVLSKACSDRQSQHCRCCEASMERLEEIPKQQTSLLPFSKIYNTPSL